MGENKSHNHEAKTAKRSVLPRSLKALACVILFVALWNIGSVHYLPGGHHHLSTTREHHDLQMKRFVDSSANRLPRRTLALVYPPGLMGGYRNQVIRFIGLCLYAKRNNMTQLLEPSLLWSTQLHGIGTSVQWFPIPMHWLFDIDYWNEVAKTEGLPRIVPDVPSLSSDCWQAGLFDQYNTSDWGPLPRAAFLETKSLVGVTNETYRMISNDPTFKARRTDVLPAVSHCTQPFVYGGGKMGGRLWNDIMKYRERNGAAALPDHIDRAVLRALQPAPRWQQVANSCLADRASSYVALHARIELEMFSHPCGKTMERNLTNILSQVQHLVQAREHEEPHLNITGLFIAVSRTGMAYSDEYTRRLREIADYNVQVFDYYTGHAHARLGEHLNVFECGERLLQDFYRENPNVPDHGSLLQAVVNFHLAVNAAIFVGVRGSSYSTDVWTTRYHLGKGKDNYRYTTDGAVEAIENGGLPDPHVNCGTLNRKVAQNAGGMMMMMNKR